MADKNKDTLCDMEDYKRRSLSLLDGGSSGKCPKLYHFHFFYRSNHCYTFFSP